jgi:hypothetical protein
MSFKLKRLLRCSDGYQTETITSLQAELQCDHWFEERRGMKQMAGLVYLPFIAMVGVFYECTM